MGKEENEHSIEWNGNKVISSLFSFERSTGSVKDLKELEYLSALHQTDVNIRKNASIKAQDIASFLRSRFDINVSEQEVRSKICYGFTRGGDDDDDEEEEEEEENDQLLDLSELVSILFIPYLLNEARKRKKVVKESEEESPSSSNDVEAGETFQTIFERVLELILEDTIGITTDQKLDKNALSSILLHFGEQELANDDQILEEMVQSLSSHGSNVKLTKETFQRALISDVLLYSEEREKTIPLLLQQRRSVEKYQEAGTILDQNSFLQRFVSNSFRKISLTFSIDPIIESYFSRTFVVILWSLFLTSFFAYLYFLSGTYLNYCVNQSSTVCYFGQAILHWTLVLLGLAIFGIVFVGFGGMGNSATTQSALPLIASLFVVILASCPPFLVLLYNNFEFSGNATDSTESQDKYASLAYQRVAYFSCFSLAILTVAIQLFRLGFFVRNSSMRERLGVPHAAQNKLGEMVYNALRIHDLCRVSKSDAEKSLGSASTRAISKFFKNSEKLVLLDGGLLWTLKQIATTNLEQKHGIRIPVRILAGNFSLIFISAFIICAGLSIIRYVDAHFGESHEVYLMERFEQIFVSQELTIYSNGTMAQLQNNLQILNFSLSTEQKLNLQAVLYDEIKNITYKVSKKSFDYLYPEEKSMVLIPLIVLIVFAFATSIYFILVYIPSTVSMIIRMRTGVIPTLQSKSFSRLRQAPDLSTLMIGNMFWGSLYSSLLVGGFFSLFIFVFLWQITSKYAFVVLFYFVGFFIAINLIITTYVCLRKNRYYIIFYRKNPASTSLVELFLEFWSIALTTGTVFVRGITLTLTTLLHVGRVDVPLLSSKVGIIGSYDVDPYPVSFRRTLVSYEAHNHPYMETLGTIYILKLAYDKKFGTRAGSCWRLLFVSALMPWIRQYRLMKRSDNIFISQFMMKAYEKQGTIAADENIAESKVGDSKEEKSDKVQDINKERYIES